MIAATSSIPLRWAVRMTLTNPERPGAEPEDPRRRDIAIAHRRRVCVDVHMKR